MVRVPALLVVLLLALTGCGGPVHDVRVRIATGQPGGVYYVYGGGLAKAVGEHIPGARSEVLRTGASLDNLERVTAGRAEVAFTLADSAAAAVTGSAPFEGKLPVRALARLYDNYVYLAVRSDFDGAGLEDLSGRKVSVGAEGSGTGLIAERMLSVSGVRDVRRRKLGLGPSAAALRKGEIDAFFFSGGRPVTDIRELAEDGLLRLLDLEREAELMRGRYGEVYSERTMPASAYGLRKPTRTVGVRNYLVVHEAMDAELAYELTRTLFTARDQIAAVHPEAARLNERAAYATHPVPLHPGAIRYYRETRS